MGLSGNLTTGEILEQLLHARRIEKIGNVVFMGMGEPLDNYTNVITAVRAMIDVKQFSMKGSKVCVSTVGVVPRMHQFLEDAPTVHLALSLHAPTQELRTKIVPTAKAWSIEKLIVAVEERTRAGFKVMIEYILIDQLNDTVETAHELGKLLEGKNVHVNLIPYNPTVTKESYNPPTKENIFQFHKIIREQYNVSASIRRTMGQEIAGACGQLVVNKKKEKLKDIEDLYQEESKSSNKIVLKKTKKDTIEKESSNSILWIFVPFLLILFVLFKFLYY